MKRIFCLSFSFIAFILVARSQHSNSGNNDKNVVIFNNYIIQLKPLSGNGYGYDIIYQQKLLVHQDKNPFTQEPGGLKNKEDAIRVAKWQVLRLMPSLKQQLLNNPQIPIEVARQLNIPGY